MRDFLSSSLIERLMDFLCGHVALAILVHVPKLRFSSKYSDALALRSSKLRFKSRGRRRPKPAQGDNLFNNFKVEICHYLPKLDRHWNGDGPAPDRLVVHGDLAVASSEDEVADASSYFADVSVFGFD